MFGLKLQEKTRRKVWMILSCYSNMRKSYKKISVNITSKISIQCRMTRIVRRNIRSRKSL